MNGEKWKDREMDPLQEHNTESHRLTIESIQSAMIQLLEKKDFRSITIKEVVERAGVSRSAFYRSYQSKEEVLQSIIHDSFRKIAEEMKSMEDSGSARSWKKMIAGIAASCGSMYTLMSPDAWQGGTMLQCMNDYMTDMLPMPDRKYEPLYRFWMGGTYNMIQYWLDGGMKETPEELADTIMKCIRI